MQLKWRWFAFAGAAFGALAIIYVAAANPYALLVFFTKPLSPPTPPLLAGAQAGDQLICPPHDSTEEILARPPQKGSTEVEARLARQFPAGVDESRLVATLRVQGFRFVDECDNDPTIHGAQFVQSGGGFWGPYPVYADIAWKADLAGKIVWTKANVAYTGP
jgi:hypothetical protein